MNSSIKVVAPEPLRITKTRSPLRASIAAKSRSSISWAVSSAVISREAEIPTGLPLAPDFAVAVPHTDREHVLRAGFALGTLTEPVPFRSMENPDEELPVRVVFALAITDKNEQIDMLQAVAELLQDPPTIRRIADATSASEILAALGVAATASEG